MPRRLPVGAEPRAAGGVDLRVWPTRARRVEVVLRDYGQAGPLPHEPGGYHAGVVEAARTGTRYRFRLDSGHLLPDPASRFQPDGPHGPSAVVDPSTFPWTDGGWRGVRLAGQVIYEMHIGTFAPA